MSNQNTALQKDRAPQPVITQYLTKYKDQIAAALPKHMTADRMARIVTTEIRKVPQLAECNPVSLFGAVIQASQLGLEPGSALGHCYLIPFNNRNQKTKDVQLIIGYRGMIDLARRSGQIISIEARAVYAADDFSYQFGLNPDLHHVPFRGHIKDRGPAVAFYAVARLQGGGIQWDVLTDEEVNAIRDESDGYKAFKKGWIKSTPWVTHPEEMGKKSVIRRLYKYLPISIEIQRAVGLDEQADAGINQANNAVIDGEYMTLGDEQDQPAAETEPQTRTRSTSNKLRDQAEAAKQAKAAPALAQIPSTLDEWVTSITGCATDEQVFELLELAKANLQGEDLQDVEIIGSNRIDELSMEQAG